MPVRRVGANEKVEADRGRVALVRGPLVYCVEGADVEGGKVLDLVLAGRRRSGHRLSRRFAEAACRWYRHVHLPRSGWHANASIQRFTAIPYYAWAHRGKGEMAVWLPRDAAASERELILGRDGQPI